MYVTVPTGIRNPSVSGKRDGNPGNSPRDPAGGSITVSQLGAQLVCNLYQVCYANAT